MAIEDSFRTSTFPLGIVHLGKKLRELILCETSCSYHLDHAAIFALPANGDCRSRTLSIFVGGKSAPSSGPDLRWVTQALSLR